MLHRSNLVKVYRTDRGLDESSTITDGTHSLRILSSIQRLLPSVGRRPNLYLIYSCTCRTGRRCWTSRPAA